MEGHTDRRVVVGTAPPIVISMHPSGLNLGLRLIGNTSAAFD